MTRPAACFVLPLLLLLPGCDRAPSAAAPPDPNLAKLGTVEVTARLEEIPEGAIFRKGLYDYATVLKYTVTAVQRGEVKVGDTLYVAHYNPFKPRADAADKFVKNTGGTLTSFAAGATHHMALDVPAEKHYMGAIVNKFLDTASGPLYWAAYTTAGR